MQGEDNGGLLFNGHRVLVFRDEKGSREWLHSDVSALNTTELYA